MFESLNNKTISLEALFERIRKDLAIAAEPCYDASLIAGNWPRIAWIARQRYESGWTYEGSYFSQEDGMPYTRWSQERIPSCSGGSVQLEQGEA
jgi:hypothetical protein